MEKRSSRPQPQSDKHKRERKVSKWVNVYLDTFATILGKPTVLIESLGEGEGVLEFGPRGSGGGGSKGAPEVGAHPFEVIWGEVRYGGQDRQAGRRAGD